MKNIRIISLLLALSLLTACAATPEQSAVTRKDQQQLIETAASLEDTSLTIADQVDAPERWETAFSNKAGDLTVTADAEVRIPSADRAKIIRVKQRDFTQDEVDRWTEYLFPGETLYDPDVLGELTKAELEQRLIQYRRELEQVLVRDEGDEPAFSESVAASEVTLGEGEAETESASEASVNHGDYLREEITNLERAIQTAPEKRIWKETDNKIKKIPYNEDSSYMAFAVPDDSESSMRLLEVYNVPGFQSVSYLNRGDMVRNSSNYLEDSDRFDEKEKQYWQNTSEPSLSKQNAQEIALDFLRDMGLDESMTVVSADFVMTVPGETDLFDNYYGSVFKCWKIEFARELDGVSITKVYEQGSSPEDDEWWSYEHPIVYVDDNGVREFWYEGPYQIGETLVENCRLLTFDQISEIFQRYCIAVYEPDLGDRVKTKKTCFDITDVQFGYTRITETNAEFSGLLVPTWTFIGTQTEDRVFKDGTTDTWSVPESTLLTINAIDGTIIDLNQGY